nr:unnamed protein product [Callosobruchus chinensis]
MDGVDRGNQNISLYRISVRKKKWYFPLFAQCVDMAVHNAWQLHRFQGGKIDQLKFWRALTGNLLETNQKDVKRVPSKRNPKQNAYSRYDGLTHLIIYQETNNAVVNARKKFSSAVENVTFRYTRNFVLKSIILNNLFLSYTECYTE